MSRGSSAIDLCHFFYKTVNLSLLHLLLLLFQVLLYHPLRLLWLHVAELGVELVPVLLVLGHSFDHFVEYGCFRNENALRDFIFVEALLGVDVVLDAERLEPLERLLRI